MSLTIVADDLTGACDAGALFAGGGCVGLFVEPTVPGPDWKVAVADTESRSLAPAVAALRVRRAAGLMGARLGDGRLFKKIDSTMRGSVGAEIEALLGEGRVAALLCPSFPPERRTVVGGVLRVHGIPAHESPVGRDPDYPAATSDLLAILSTQVRCPVAHVPLETVRSGEAGIRAAVGVGRRGIVVADAETDADLDALAEVGAAEPSLLLAGSAGLAGRFAVTLGLAGDPVPLPPGRCRLIVAGSLHPATRAQLDALAATGMPGAWVAADGPCPDPAPLVAALAAGEPAFAATCPRAVPPDPWARHAMADRLAGLATAVLEAITPDLVCVSGGETALALMRALGATRLDLLGAPGSGLALSDVVLRASPTPGRLPLRLLTKAGGFGPPHLLVTLTRDPRP